MGRVTARRRVVRIRRGTEPTTRADTLAGEEPLEIRIGGQPFTVTMRTPGNDVELATGFLVSEGIIARADDLVTARYCAGTDASGANTYNVLDVALAAHVTPPAPNRSLPSSSACGVCGKDSIDDVAVRSRFDLRTDDFRVAATTVLALPDRLRQGQKTFDKTGGLHAAGLIDAATGEMLVIREDIGRHNAVDKVIGWALARDLLPLRAHILQVSGRAGFELVQKAVMAGVPMLSAVSAPSSLAADLADEQGLTLAGFVRGESMVLYTHPERVTDTTVD
ncbi:formate dehydrogenase accessory sulfurtransferase FdhD [Gordonia desulfuricans]|uniref:Sulfur carrier protein FdhD n=1 Tax=Gordonia desulfuricans TaxID=89051 RepID=A0A7K3LUI7_9ACTN|nr:MULTISPECIES: formate dehydrogenase accessory sulfurtransferase FdhD [Gordonia]EMP11885.2 formate dehydrogenase [Gordonia sp. NB41Y]NDK91933.1 formate dehydrogenase accessory sulfurtransferase FdhD [Gordonia desulfuricans]WLP89751.1 formate dehydrogenase accessory sulfurtransferase FdhD [Gordonia sp. NB41Y]